MHPLFQGEEGGSTPTSALSLRLEEVTFDYAKELNRLWHSRLPRLGVGAVKTMPFLSYAAVFDGVAYAVAIWSNPVARNLPQQEWLELRRLATAPDSPRNTASRMLGVMAKLIRRNRPGVTRLVSYHDTEVHTGCIYRAAGWAATTINDDGNWTRPGRNRPKAQSEAPKQRWELVIRQPEPKEEKDGTQGHHGGGVAGVRLPGPRLPHPESGLPFHWDDDAPGR